MTGPAALRTERLVLRPSTPELARAEIADRARFAALLGAEVPAAWPPEELAPALGILLARLEAEPAACGWFAWYALAPREEAPPVLVGSAGFTGPPRQGEVEIGYSVMPEFQRRGYATEMVRALSRRALAQDGVTRVTARTEWANPASVRVLEKAGFHACGPRDEAGGARFEVHRC